MDYQYKLIVSNHGIYKEFEIPSNIEKVRLGTTSRCEYRLNSDFFFGAIELEFEKNDGWTVSCGDNLYISCGDVRKLYFTSIKHGDLISIYYENSGQIAFELRFMIDFEWKVPKYNCCIDLNGVNSVTISDEQNADIVLNSNFAKNNKVILKNSEQKFFVEEINSEYGIYINGKKVETKEKLNDYDFLSIGDFSFYFKENKLYFSNEGIVVHKYAVSMIKDKFVSIYPKFVRNTRLKSVIDEEPIKILEPENIPKEPDLNIVTSLMPTLAMFALVVVMKGIMNTSGGTYAIFMICSMGLGVVTSIVSIIHQRRKYKKDCEKRKIVYNDYINKKREDIVKARGEELECLNDSFFSTELDIEHISEFDAKLFDRTPDDDDFLEIYLGRGEREAKRTIDYKIQEKLESGDELTKVPEELGKEFKNIKSAPVTIAMRDANAIGVIGSDNELNQMIKIIMVDLISRHYFGDVNIYTLINENDVQKYDWIRLIPHLQGDGNYRNIVCDSESKNAIFDNLYKELTYRSEVKADFKYNVILVMDEYGIKRHPISRFVEFASELNTVFVFFENSEEFLPLHCSKIIKLQGENHGEVFDTSDKTKRNSFVYENVSDEQLKKVAEILAPVYCEEISLESSLRKSISLYELLHIFAAEDLDLGKRWNESKIYNSMAAPLGVNSKDEVVYLNLHEKAHGPHGLVAGTTGSGKSEILQAYILSAATLFHPYEIGFVIIDFKGGGMVNQFRDLPHLIGAITNIDGNGIQRSLKSIKAELVKRQSYFAEAGVNHIDKYIRLYKEGKVSEALPHLVIIVDEFAELKAEQPEFMKELVSAARIGRSLGVHLILATQKPTGVVDAQIWSNSKFKLCLKVQSKEDSNEVLKTPLAAEIKEPGRAYLQVGNNEIFELFQSAYSGASAAIDDAETNRKFEINQLKFSGARKQVFKTKKVESNTNSKNQLEAVVEYIADYCKENEIEKLADICMPPLPEVMNYVPTSKIKGDNICVNLGIVDDPDHQAQNPMVLDLTAKNYMIIGSSQSGKTNALQLIIRNLAENYNPDDVNIYIADFGSMILKNFAELNHVGGVVCSYEDEKLKNLFKLLVSEVKTRKERLAEIGVSSFSAYKEAGYTDLPQIIVIIDNMTALKELYLQEQDDLLPLCRDGGVVGVSFIIANVQTAGIGYRYLNNFEGRITMFCNESTEYGTMFESTRMRIPNIAGRALVQINKEVYEAQTYLAFGGEKEFERVQAIQEFVEEQNKNCEGMRAKVIPEIPKELTDEYMNKVYPELKRDGIVALGMDYGAIAPVEYDLAKNGMLVVSGQKEKGARTFTKYFVEKLIENAAQNVDLYIMDSIAKVWSDYEFSRNTAVYSNNAETIASTFDEVVQLVESRYESVSVGQSIEDEPWVVIIIEGNDVITDISADKARGTFIRNMLGKYKGLRTFILFSDVDNASIAFNAPEIMKIIKDNRKYLIFEDVSSIKLCDISLSLSKKYAKEIEMYDAYLIDDTNLKKIRCVQ